MGEPRFDSEPRDRRIYVMPEPGPQTRPIPSRIVRVPVAQFPPQPNCVERPSETQDARVLLDAPTSRERKNRQRHETASTTLPPASHPPVTTSPAVPIVAPAPTERDSFLGALERHGGWVRARTLAIVTGVPEIRACQLLERLWRAGLVRRHGRAFCPREEREYMLEGTQGGLMKRCAICGNDLGKDMFASVTGEKCCAICKLKFIGGLPTSDERIEASRLRLGLADGEYLQQDNGAEAMRILSHRR